MSESFVLIYDITNLYLFPHHYKINDIIASNFCEVKTCACLFEFKVLAFSVIDFLRYLLYQRMTWHDCRMEQNHYQNILLIMFLVYSKPHYAGFPIMLIIVWAQYNLMTDLNIHCFSSIETFNYFYNDLGIFIETWLEYNLQQE